MFATITRGDGKYLIFLVVVHSLHHHQTLDALVQFQLQRRVLIQNSGEIVLGLVRRTLSRDV